MEGQTARAYEKAGDKAFKGKDYGAALEYYRNALEIKPKKVSISYKYAEVARLFYAYDFAVEYYKKVKESKEAKNFPLTDFWLGKVHQSMGRYPKAIEYLNTYLKDSGNSTYEKEARSAIEYCQWAEQVVANGDSLQIIQLNKRVNSPYSEFGPLLKGDTLFYTSFKYNNTSDTYDPPRKISKILTSVKGGRSKPLRNRINEKGKLTAHTTFSPDGNRMYYTICEYKGSMEIRCAIYYREKDKKRRRWAKAKKLPKTVNQEGTSSTHPCIGIDPKSGKEVLYFTSDRAGGKGKLDIWYTERSESGKYGEVKNLEAVNTPEDELTPFYHATSQSLFFSSDGRQGLGGYDIYKIQSSEKGWTEPVHTGYPLNSSYNDVYFFINADSTVAYLSSNREGSMYLEPTNKSCCNDIYKVIIPQAEPPSEPEPIDSSAIVIEEVPELPPVAPEPELPEPEIEVPPSTLEDFLPLALYFDNDEPDKRTRRNTTRKSYLQTFEPYYGRKEEFRREYAVGLGGEQRINAEAQIENFFENKVKKGGDYLALFSDILLRRLQEGEEVEIFVKGYTSPRAKSDYNIHLGKRRISSVKNHFKTYQNGIFKDYLKNGKLIITERSFGETTASTSINDDLNNQRLSIYSPDASLERRVEIVEIIRQ